MPRLQVISVEKNRKAFDNRLLYIGRPDKCAGRYIGAVNLFIDDYHCPEPCLREQIYRMIQIHHAENRRLGIHVHLTFNDVERQHLTADSLLRLSYDFCGKNLPFCMVYFAVHDTTPNLHVHFLIVPINVYDGKTWSAGLQGWYYLGNEIARMMKNYIPAEEIGPVQVTYGRTPRNKRKHTEN